MLSPAHKEKAGRFLTAGELRLLVLAALTIPGMIMISTQIEAPPWLHSIALFGHLVSLLIGFGSVLPWTGTGCSSCCGCCRCEPFCCRLTE